MTNYQRRALPVQAWKYDGSDRNEWPQWVQDYSVYGPLGATKISVQLGQFVIPTKGISLNANVGDWIVVEGGTAIGLTEAQFLEEFEAVAEDANAGSQE